MGPRAPEDSRKVPGSFPGRHVGGHVGSHVAGHVGRYVAVFSEVGKARKESNSLRSGANSRRIAMHHPSHIRYDTLLGEPWELRFA